MSVDRRGGRRLIDVAAALDARVREVVRAELAQADLTDDGVYIVSTTEAGRRLGGMPRKRVAELCDAGELEFIEVEGVRGRAVLVESLRAYVERQRRPQGRRARIARAS